QERGLDRQRTCSLDRLGVVFVDVATPGVGILVRRSTQTRVVIPVQMVVGIDEARNQMTVRDADRGIVIGRPRDAAILDGDDGIRRLDAVSHEARSNMSSSTSGSPR